jgi:hypothetical protein
MMTNRRTHANAAGDHRDANHEHNLDGDVGRWLVASTKTCFFQAMPLDAIR